MNGANITVNRVFTADDADALAGTQLDQVPGPGMFNIWCGSDQADSLITISLGSITLVNAQAIAQRTNGMPNLNEDVPFSIPSPGGSRPVILIDEVTAATGIHLIVVFSPA